MRDRREGKEKQRKDCHVRRDKGEGKRDASILLTELFQEEEKSLRDLFPDWERWV
jgi:hypothetical protein